VNLLEGAKEMIRTQIFSKELLSLAVTSKYATVGLPITFLELNDMLAINCLTRSLSII
jgi:hypothetical protein